jgi:hypothetical protein
VVARSIDRLATAGIHTLAIRIILLHFSLNRCQTAARWGSVYWAKNRKSSAQ